jgi:hypothetical protein
MNLRQRVWLPPDGDNRLVRLQDSLARACGTDPMTLVPPFLALKAEGVPVGPLRTGDWRWSADGPLGLGAFDSRGPVGLFVFDLEAVDAEVAFPLAPGWTWTRGRVATLVLTAPRQGRNYRLWSWEGLSGWKSDHPRG